MYSTLGIEYFGGASWSIVLKFGVLGMNNDVFVYIYVVMTE